jgi:hypothetical protein
MPEIFSSGVVILLSGSDCVIYFIPFVIYLTESLLFNYFFSDISYSFLSSYFFFCLYHYVRGIIFLLNPSNFSSTFISFLSISLFPQQQFLVLSMAFFHLLQFLFYLSPLSSAFISFSISPAFLLHLYIFLYLPPFLCIYFFGYLSHFFYCIIYFSIHFTLSSAATISFSIPLMLSTA